MRHLSRQRHFRPPLCPLRLLVSSGPSGHSRVSTPAPFALSFFGFLLCACEKQARNERVFIGMQRKSFLTNLIFGFMWNMNPHRNDGYRATFPPYDRSHSSEVRRSL